MQKVPSEVGGGAWDRVIHLFFLHTINFHKNVQRGMVPYACDPSTWVGCHEFGAGLGYLVSLPFLSKTTTKE